MSIGSDIFDKINIASVVNKHFATFYHYEKLKFHGKKEYIASDLILFGLVPPLISIFLCWNDMFLNKDYVNIIIICLSIFIGLLFGFLTMVYSLVQENQKIKIDVIIDVKEKKKVVAKIDLTVYLFINIAYSIVLTIIALVFVLLTQFYPFKIINLINSYTWYSTVKQIYLYATNGISFFLLIQFILVLLLIIKRFTVLFMNQISI